MLTTISFRMIVALVVLVLLISLRLLLRFWIRQRLIAVGKTAISKQPDHIHLEPIPEDAWKKAKTTHSFIQPLLDLHFQPAGSFKIRELPDIKVHFQILESEHVYGVVYEHPKIGSWLNLICIYQNGSRITFTNRQNGSQLESNPRTPIIPVAGACSKELYLFFQKNHPSEGLKKLTPQELPRLFEKAHEESLAWFKSKGLRTEEVASVALNQKTTPSIHVSSPTVTPRFYVSRHGQQEGPLTVSEIKAKLQSGLLDTHDFGWHEGLIDWVPISQIQLEDTTTS